MKADAIDSRRKMLTNGVAATILGWNEKQLGDKCTNIFRECSVFHLYYAAVWAARSRFHDCDVSYKDDWNLKKLIEVANEKDIDLLMPQYFYDNVVRLEDWSKGSMVQHAIQIDSADIKETVKQLQNWLENFTKCGLETE